MGRWQIGLALIFISVVTSVWANHPDEHDAQQQVQGMFEASQKVSYSGHSVLLSGGHLTSLSIYHAPFDGVVWERIVHMNGDPAEIIRKGSEVICLHRESAMRLAPVGPLMAFKNGLDDASKYYQFQQVAAERVAGRPAMRVDVSPKDEHRYGYSLWLDQEAGILLKSQTNSDTADPLEVFEFIKVEVGGALTKADFTPGSDLSQQYQQKQGQTPADDRKQDQPWSLAWLPEGFQQIKSFMQPSGEAPFSARVYSDGLAAFTVFYDKGASRQSIRFRGATVAVNHSAYGGSVTVVGEIPLATAQKVAESVKLLASTP